MRVATTFAEVDRICDYIPFVSTLSNIVDLFQKCVYKCLPENIAKNRYWTHIKWKEISRCIILLVPILGNLYIIIDDYFKYKKDKISCDQAIQYHQESQRSRANMLAMFARQTSGLQVTGNQMMPAPTEDEQRLCDACIGNDSQPIRELLQKGISPNFYHVGQTPLITACQHSTAEVVRLLIESGAEVNTFNRMGNSPFAAACTKGNIEMVQLLRPRVQDINTPNAKGITPLMFAVTSGNQDVVQFLIAQGADRNAACPDGSDALICALLLADHAHLLPLLLPEEADVDARRYQFQIPSFNLFSLFAVPLTIQNLTPLLCATLFGAKNSAIYLVARSNVLHLDSTNSNALYYASEHMPLLQALLNKCHTPEFVNQQNTVGSTALHHAIELDRPDAALLLLQNGANPFIPDAEGKIPLLVACEKDFVNVVEYIQEHCADRITGEIGEQVAVATQAAIARRGQAAQAQPEKQDSASVALGLIQTGLNSMRSDLEHRANRAQEMEDLGPLPRTGMELFLGRLPWPVY